MPSAPDRQLNYVRLVLDDGTEVARTYPPRNDIAHRFTWNLASHTGQRGHVEVVDGITDSDGFAWLAVSRFEPAVISSPVEPIGEPGSVHAKLYRLAGQLKLVELTDQVEQAASSNNVNQITRLAAAEALVMLNPERAIPSLSEMMEDSAARTATRCHAAELLGRIDRSEARSTLLAGLKSAPESVASTIAAGLAGNQVSAGELLKEIRQGRASAGLLREAAVVDRLKAAGLPHVDEQIAELTADLSPADDRITKLIAERRANYLAGKFDAELGRAVFAKSVCASCHRISDVGKTLGPALDGIGSRGLDRLLEDTLDPNRNVDLAFRTVTIETESGQVLSGFGLREDGKMLVYHDTNGAPAQLPLSEVADRAESRLSPMPGNIIEQMPEQDFYSLLAYLLSLRGK